MALENAVLAAGVNGAVTVLGFGAIHSAATSGSQVSNERIAIGWDPAVGVVAASGDVPLAFTGTPGGPATHFGLWSASTAGTFRGAVPLSGDQTFNAGGAYNVTAVTLTGTDES